MQNYFSIARQVSKFLKFAIPLLALAALGACQSMSSRSSGESFIPDAPVAGNQLSGMSQERINQQKELEGYVARTSDRRLMKLPKDLDITLSGALKKSTKVDFSSDDNFSEHRMPYRLTDYTTKINYRPVFNDAYNVSGSVR